MHLILTIILRIKYTPVIRSMAEQRAEEGHIQIQTELN